MYLLVSLGDAVVRSILSKVRLAPLSTLKLPLEIMLPLENVLDPVIVILLLDPVDLIKSLPLARLKLGSII